MKIAVYIKRLRDGHISILMPTIPAISATGATIG